MTTQIKEAIEENKKNKLPEEIQKMINKLAIPIRVNSLQEAAKLEVDEEADQQTATQILQIKEKAKSLLSEEEKVLIEFNQDYGIVHTTSTYILIEKGTGIFILDSRSSFINFHENNYFTNKEGKQENKAKFWLRHPLRRTYTDIVFDVTKPPTFINQKGEEIYNMFKGYAFKPKQGDASLYWYHLKYVICSGNEELYLYVRKRLASIVQNPKVLGCAIVLRGKQGTGKNQCIEHFGKLFGKHFLIFTSLDRLTGRFNSHLQHAVVLFANEATWGGNKKQTGALKSVITDNIIFIEGKGKDGFQIENARHLFVASNEDWVVPRDIDDRRFLVLDVSSEHKEDYEYFAALDKQMNEGGYEALLYDLQNEDLTNFNPRIIPINDSAFDMKLQTMTTSQQYLYYALDEKCWHLAGNEQYFEFKTEKGTNDLYKDYKAWCEDEKKVPQSKGQLGETVINIIKAKKIRKGTLSRIQTYIFPSLEECRKHFETYSKQTRKIWSDNE